MTMTTGQKVRAALRELKTATGFRRRMLLGKIDSLAACLSSELRDSVMRTAKRIGK